GIIEDFDPATIVTDRAGLRMLRAADWVQTLGLCAATRAAEDAKLEGAVDPTRFGVFMGAGRGGSEAVHVLGRAHFKELVERAQEWTSTNVDWRTLDL